MQHINISSMIPALLVALLIQNYPTSSFSLSPIHNRFWTPLRASEDIYNSDDKESSSNEEDSPNRFEKFVRNVSNQKDYKFGDITKKMVNTTTTGVEGAVKSVTGNEDYHFGDLTKNVIGSTTHVLEEGIQAVTGNEEYNFGDLSRGAIQRAGSALTYSEKTLSLMRDANIHEAIELLNIFWNKSMTEAERKEAFTVVVYLGAIMVLAYNLIANVMNGMVFAATWTKVSMATGASPVSVWPLFLERKATMDMFFGNPFLPARAIITIPFFFRYRKFVVAMANRSIFREKFPIINRYMSLIMSWLIANLGLVGGFTYLLIKVSSLVTGVPVFPVVS